MPDASSPEVTIETQTLIMACCAELRCGRHAEAAVSIQKLVPCFVERMASVPEELSDQFQAALATALAAQERGDWIGLADELQYKLAELLS